MRVGKFAIAGSSVLLLLQGCSLMRQGAPSEQQFRRHQPSHPYVADPARAMAIVSGAKQLDVCTRRSEVLRLMGEPDFGVLTYDSNGNHNAVQWTYLVSEEPNARQDVKVTLNKAHDVVSVVRLGLSEVTISTVSDGPGCESR